METPILNNHNKQEYPPMHTAEHLLNGEMARRYGKGRVFSAHIERKKTKSDYHLDKALTDDEIKSLSTTPDMAKAPESLANVNITRTMRRTMIYEVRK